MIRVDHLNTGVHGGAAIAALRLHRALVETGVESTFWHSSPGDREADKTLKGIQEWPSRNTGQARRLGTKILAYARRSKETARVNWALAGRPKGLGFFNVPWLPQATPWHPEMFGGQIVHLHWVARFIDYPSFFGAISDDFPIVWTLHDVWPLTGGCHYPGDCRAYLSECKNCPQLGRRGEQDLSNRSFHVKRKALTGKNLHIVTPSGWLEENARRSPLLSTAESFRTIPLGLDTEFFRPRNKAEARQQLDLPDDRVVLVFGAESIDDRRKGLRELLTALTLVGSGAHILALVFGKGDIKGWSSRLPNLMPLGYIDDPDKQVTIYSAADMVVVPSLEDNSPQTVAEAMACGTPVIGFKAGGIPEYVRPLQTGLLAEVGDPVSLAEEITWLADRPEVRHRMGENARAMIQRGFRADRQAETYRRLYDALVPDRTAAGDRAGDGSRC